MSCARHEAALREHALGGPLDLSLERHLAECAACRETLMAERRVLSGIDVALDVLRHTEPSPAFLARARGQLAGPRPSFGWLDRPRWYPLLAMAAAALAVAFGVMTARTRPPGDDRPQTAERTGTSPSPVERAAAPPDAPTPRTAAAATTRSAPPPPPPPDPAFVPPGQEETLVRFAALLATGEVAPPTLLVEPPDPARDLDSPADLNLRALAIEPIAREGADTEGDTL